MIRAPVRRLVFLTAVLLAAACLQPLPAQEAPPGQEVFEIVELAPDVLAAVVVPRPPAYAFANSLVILSDEGVLVVDTQQSPTAARALIAEIRARTDAPVRWVVHTHWHGDHVWGNQAYRSAWPGVSFIAHRRTRKRLVEAGRSEVEELLASLPDRIAQRREWLETGRHPRAGELSPEQIESVRYSLAVNEAYLKDLRSLELIHPDVVFDRNLTLYVGDVRVELIHVGPSHTKGDVIVHLPDRGIVAVGDLIEGAPPYLEHADLRGWARALERIEALEPTAVVGAHAHPDQGLELLHWQADFFRALVNRVEESLGRGGGPEAVADRVSMDDFRESFLALGVSEDALDTWLREAVERAARQLDGPGG